MPRFKEKGPRPTALRIAATYGILGALWILFSDRLANAIASTREQLITIQSVKGWLFVSISTIAIYALVVRSQHRLESKNRELKTTLRQAELLHRILRHNLRNACTAIGGAIDHLDVNSSDEKRRLKEIIQRQNENLISLSDKSRYLREFLSPGPVTTSTYDLVVIVESEVAKARDNYPDASFQVATPDSAHVRAHKFLDEAVEELIENAVEHNDTSTQSVWVTVQTSDGLATLSVEDDGPGIPDEERIVVRREYETQMHHSQGLGLWLVSMTIQRSNGTLTFEDSEPEGSKIRVELPVAK